MAWQPKNIAEALHGPAFFTVADLAKRWRVDRRVVLSLIDRDRLAAVKVGRSWRVARRAVREFEGAGGAR